MTSRINGYLIVAIANVLAVAFAAGVLYASITARLEAHEQEAVKMTRYLREICINTARTDDALARCARWDTP